MKFPKYYVGPMSKNVVDSVLAHDYPIGLIISRRQIDYSSGYVNGWNTRAFTEYVKDRSSVLLCRDHGGENQGATDDNGVESFECDSNHLDLIHIDPFKTSRSIQQAAEKTAEHIERIFALNSNIMYEVGTEESIFHYEPEHLDQLLSYLQKTLSEDQFNQIKYAVIQSGTRLDLATRTNTGKFDQRRLETFIEIVRKYELMSKEHNGDYLTETLNVESRFEIGLDAINIAPEYGQIESEFYLDVCKDDAELFDGLFQICYNSGMWRKWVGNSKISKSQLILVCCHYVLSSNLFLKNIKSHFPDADRLIQTRINSQLELLSEQTKNYCI